MTEELFVSDKRKIDLVMLSYEYSCIWFMHQTDSMPLTKETGERVKARLALFR